MTKIINAENLRQYRRRFSLIVEQIMALLLALSWLASQNFKRIAC